MRSRFSRKSKVLLYQWILSLTILLLVSFLFLQQNEIIIVVDPSARQHASPLLLQDDLNFKKKNPIKQISILGERNSGTRWTFDHLQECFGHALAVEKGLTRYKHWFQYNNSEKYLHDTLVINQFRNPYDWFKAMERVPHHAPNHLRTHPNATTDASHSFNDWKIFLTRPWTMERVGSDLEYSVDDMCQEDFLYRDIISCEAEPLPRKHYHHKLRYSENEPFYEMRNDGSGEPYDSIIDLRADKIRNFLSVRDYPNVADVWIVQYEYLVSKGTRDLIRKLEFWTGIQANCEVKPPQFRKQRRTRTVSREFAEHVRKHVNWTVESWIGYNVEPHREDVVQEWS